MKVLLVTLFIVIADQITKLYVKGISIPKLGIDIPGMPYQSSIKVIGDFFKITFIENPGMAFGIQIGGKLFLSLFTIFATILLFIFLFKNRHETFFLRLALAFILGGAVGNLIDRIFYGKIYGYAPYFYGKVVDFLHLDFPNFTIFGKTIYSWPIFNVADISVSVGFLMILLGYNKIFKSEKDKDELQAENQPFPLDNSVIMIDNDSNEETGIDSLKLDPSAPGIIENTNPADITLEEEINKTKLNDDTGTENKILRNQIE